MGSGRRGSHRCVVHLEVVGQIGEIDELETVILAPLPVGLYCGHVFQSEALVHLPQRKDRAMRIFRKPKTRRYTRLALYHEKRKNIQHGRNIFFLRAMFCSPSACGARTGRVPFSPCNNKADGCEETGPSASALHTMHGFLQDQGRVR